MKNTLVYIGLVLGMTLFLASPEVYAQQGVTKDKILIGGFGPITGPAAWIGLGSRDGMSLAIKEINGAGGIHGRKLDMIFEDDAASPSRALAGVKKLIDQDKVFMLKRSRLLGWFHTDFLPPAKIPQIIPK